jgi:anti-sigma factor RsiW
MRTPQRPFDEDPSGDGAPSYEWLDEWLCEYVDGTMDPSMEAVFEQYVEANPELKAHVERLQKTREILCGCDAPESEPSDLEPEGDAGWDDALLQAPPVLAGPPGEHSGDRRGIAASIVVALIVGFLAGSMLVDPSTLSPAPTAEAVDADGSAQEAMRDAARPRPSRSAPVVQSQVSSVSGDDVFFPNTPTSSATRSDSAGASAAVTPVGDR